MSKTNDETNLEKSEEDLMELEKDKSEIELPEIKSWDDLEINEDILRGIYNYGFETPSSIQKKAILPIINGRDVVAQAQSGTGKTATFAIGALSHVDLSSNSTQILVLSPTKELALQTSEVIKSLGSMMNGLIVEVMFGGIERTFERRNAFLNRKNAHIMCGCPGKILDLMRRQTLCPSNIKLVIMDEVDEMLSDGFKEQVYDIFQNLNTTTQVALFSATMPNNIQAIVNQIVRNPVQILVKSEQLSLEGIEQFYIALDNDEQKYNVLKDLFSYLSVSQCIIYCNSVSRVSALYDAMIDDEFPVSCIHGNMTKDERQKSFISFKKGESRVLLSTNITSRGIDIQQVSVVINFDLPTSVDNYLHRIGRSGRWGRKGVGINLVTRRDVNQLRNIENHYNREIKEMPSDLKCLGNC